MAKETLNKEDSKDEKSNKNASLINTLKNIEKIFGKNAVMKMDGSNIEEGINVVSSGSINLDLALGVNGLPYGRIVEIFGPESSGKTTMALSTIANAQKAGETCAFIDVEHAFDPTYAKKLGVDLKELLISQPSSAEEALSIAEILINSGAVRVIVLDSVAALVPKSELEGDMGASQVGVTARLMSKALRKLTGITKKNDVLLLFINQIRMKIGVMFGCLHGDTKITLTDGNSYPISKIVNERIKGNVWSYNEDKKIFEEKEIIGWNYNGEVESENDFLFFSAKHNISKKNAHGAFTKNHELFDMKLKKFKEAKDFVVGDIFLGRHKNIVNKDVLHFIKGTIVGNSTLKYNNWYSCFDLKFKPNASEDYLLWKASKLKMLDIKKSSKNTYISNAKDVYEFNELHKTSSNPLKVFEDGEIHPLSMAIWFAEKGNVTIDTKELILETYFKKEQDLLKLKKLFIDNGYNVEIFEYKDSLNKTNYSYKFDKEKLVPILFKYLPKVVLEKMLHHAIGENEYNELMKNNISDNDLEYDLENIEVPLRINNISTLKKESFEKDSGKYDLTIKDNHNYLAGGINNMGFIVHNSPETTSGGNALKFYASVRLDIRRTGQIKKNDEIIGNETKVKVIKNKVAPPFKVADFDIIYNMGVNREGEIIDIAVKLDIINKAGAWYSYEGNKIGQGRDKTCIYLSENPDVRDEILGKINKEVNSNGVNNLSLDDNLSDSERAKYELENESLDE